MSTRTRTAPDVYLSLKQAAELINCNRGTLSHAARQQTLKAIKVGNNWIVSITELERWLNNHDVHRNAPFKSTES